MIMTTISYSSDQWSQEQTASSYKSSRTSMIAYSPGGSSQHAWDWTTKPLPPSKDNSSPITSNSNNPSQECIPSMQRNRKYCIQGSLHHRDLLNRPGLPIQNWDRLVEQAKITLKLHQPSKLNPNLLAYFQFNGTFDYNRTPMDPPETRILVHNKPHNRGTWASHGQEGWYVRPVMLHYRCLTS